MHHSTSVCYYVVNTETFKIILKHHLKYTIDYIIENLTIPMIIAEFEMRGLDSG